MEHPLFGIVHELFGHSASKLDLMFDALLRCTSNAMDEGTLWLHFALRRTLSISEDHWAAIQLERELVRMQYDKKSDRTFGIRVANAELGSTWLVHAWLLLGFDHDGQVATVKQFRNDVLSVISVRFFDCRQGNALMILAVF